MAKKTGLDIFMNSLSDELKYSYVTILDTKTGETLCEGIAQSLSKVVIFRDLSIKSFKAFEAEDGSVLVDIYL